MGVKQIIIRRRKHTEQIGMGVITQMGTGVITQMEMGVILRTGMGS